MRNRPELHQAGHQAGWLTGTLAHAHGLAVTHQTDELHEDDVELIGALTDGVHRALHAGDMAMVIAAPDVDEQVEAAVELILVVGDVRRKVGRVAVGADEHFVLFAAELGCLVPDSAVFFVSEAAVAQVIDDSHDFAVLVQVAFEEPAVVMDAVFFHIGLHFRDVLGRPKPTSALRRSSSVTCISSSPCSLAYSLARSRMSSPW